MTMSEKDLARISRLLASENGLTLFSVDDAMDVISSGLPCCMFEMSDLAPEFFHLSNGLAGGVFQKFINYGYRVAFVLPHDHGLGDRVTELAREHARHPCVRFVASRQAGFEWLSRAEGDGRRGIA